MALSLANIGKTPDYVKKQELNIEKTGGSYLPSISVLATNAPQINKNDEKYIKGAEAGDLVITAPNPVLVKAEAGIEFIPALYREPYFVVWDCEKPAKTDKLGNRSENDKRKKRVGEAATYDKALTMCITETMAPVKTIDYCVFSPSFMSKEDQKPIIFRFDKKSRYRLADDFGEALSQDGSISSIKWRLTSEYVTTGSYSYYTFKLDAIGRPKAEEYKALTELAEVVKPQFLPTTKEPAHQITSDMVM